MHAGGLLGIASEQLWQSVTITRLRARADLILCSRMKTDVTNAAKSAVDAETNKKIETQTIYRRLIPLQSAHDMYNGLTTCMQMTISMSNYVYIMNPM